MNWRKERARGLFYLGRQENFNRDIEDEMQFHIEARADELEQTGMPRTQAVIQARREFGSSGGMREQTRSAWQIHWLEDPPSDPRYALRALRRAPRVRADAISSPAVGSGVQTAR